MKDIYSKIYIKILISFKINFHKRLQKLIILIFTNFYGD